jgi:hypothetical protein
MLNEMVYEVEMTFTHAGSTTTGILRYRYQNKAGVARRIAMNRSWMAQRGHIETGCEVREVPRYSLPGTAVAESCKENDNATSGD